MKQSPYALSFLLVALLLFCSTAVADESPPLTDWTIELENTARFDYYRYWGDPAGSPYFHTHGQFYDELSGQFTREYSPYESVLGRFNLLYNDSAYRRNQTGVFLERGSLMWEKGDTEMPFRMELGDHYAFMSTRTMQRSIKGAQLEVQPLSASPDKRNSILFFLGTESDTYNNLRMADDFYVGSSWAMENSSLGNYSFNVVRNSRTRDTDVNLPDRAQTIVSATGYKTLEIDRQKLSLEGEIARFRGDHALSAATAKENVSGMGYFGQVRGDTGTPLSYILRFENYGKDYVPAGAGVQSDHRAYSAQTGWRFQQGLNLRGRVQHYTDGVDSVNPLKTLVGGATLTGPLHITALPGLTTNMDAFLQEVKNRDRTTDYLASVARVNLSKPIQNWSSQMLLGVRKHDDQRTNGDPNEYTYDLGLSAAHALVLGSWRGSAAPGVTWQKRKGNNTDLDSYGVNFAVQLAADSHRVGLDYRLVQNDYRTAAQNDMLTHSLGMNYRYVKGPHTIGIEGFFDGRRPSPGDSTESYRIGAFYTLRFGKPAGVSLPAAARSFARELALEQAVSEAPLVADPAYIGKEISAVMADLQQIGISGGMAMPGIVVYETRLLDELFQRQRFALLTRDDIVTGSVLVVDFDDVGDSRSMSRIFDDVVAATVSRLGRPFDTYFKGEFTPDLVQDVNRGAFVRILEWKTESGMIRLGIPQRLDRQVRIELQYRESFPSQSDTYWSIETLH